MNLQLIGEHTIDISFLPVSGAKILDLGARGFSFCNAFPQHFVTSVDCDKLDGDYLQCAVSDYDGECAVKHVSDPQATTITPGMGIPCYTLKTLSEVVGCQFWDVIKIDVEGSEREIIKSMDKPWAKQISIEFHLHTGAYGQYTMRLMEVKLQQLGYIQIQHNLEKRHGLSLNYWDSLFILK